VEKAGENWYGAMGRETAFGTLTKVSREGRGGGYFRCQSKGSLARNRRGEKVFGRMVRSGTRSMEKKTIISPSQKPGNVGGDEEVSGKNNDPGSTPIRGKKLCTASVKAKQAGRARRRKRVLGTSGGGIT